MKMPLNNDQAGSVICNSVLSTLAFEPSGAFFWLASFGTDRIAKVDASSGAVVARMLMHRMNIAKGTIIIEGVTYKLKDKMATRIRDPVIPKVQR